VTPTRLGSYARNRALAGAMDAEALRQLRLPAGELAVEIPAELVAEVLRAC